MRLRVAILLLVFLLAACCAQAQTPIWPEDQPRRAKWRAYNGIAFGVNPLVLGDMFKVYRAVPITSGSHMLTRDAHVRFGAATTVSPQLAKLGPFVGISPLLIFDLDVYFNEYFDFFHLSFDSIHDPYDAHIRLRRSDEQNFYTGQNLVVSGTFKIMVAGILLVNLLDVEYFYMQDTWFSIELNAVVNDGWDYTNKTLLLYEYAPKWRIGSMFETFHVINTGYNRHMLHFGFMAEEKLPWDMSLILMSGYHLDNPDFSGLRFWTAAFKEWDL